MALTSTQCHKKVADIECREIEAARQTVTMTIAYEQEQSNTYKHLQIRCASKTRQRPRTTITLAEMISRANFAIPFVSPTTSLLELVLTLSATCVAVNCV